jgi:tRNA threonylcarbamoyladenosine biosynthesis protein TsaE
MITRAVEQTRTLGAALGRHVPPGAVIALTGDLGSGKTVLVQGLAQGLAVPAAFYITSPTYTLINEYPGRLCLYHVDLYRLTDPDELDETGLHDILGADGVVVIEWADRLPASLLNRYLRIHLVPLGPDKREITLTAYGQVFVNLLKKVEKNIEEYS